MGKGDWHVSIDAWFQGPLNGMVGREGAYYAAALKGICVSWNRDPGIEELVDYFNQQGIAPDGKHGGWEWLSVHPREMAVIEAEIRKCRNSFNYFARNYLWIRTKERERIPFRLNESQELILDEINRLRTLGRPQKLIILKARQLGCSTLIEGILSWKTILFPNTIGLIVSSNPGHSQYLFRLLQYFYDNLPWYLKPMMASRKIEEGLIFDNPDHDSRTFYPGLNSEISVQAANQTTGVGEGRTIQAAHISELGGWTDREGREVIEGDLGNALAENVQTFAVIESTARGTGNYFHRLWDKSVELGDKAEWNPVFLPWFFESNRKISIPIKTWKPEVQESEMRDRVCRDWVRCDNNPCGRFYETIRAGRSIVNDACPACHTGILLSYELLNEQLYWMQLKRMNAQKDSDSLKQLRQELTSTPEESFQASGYQVFPAQVIEFTKNQIEAPAARGMIDKFGEFHGVDTKTGTCPIKSCQVDHSYDDHPFQIYRYPDPRRQYVIGVDVAEGLGEDGDFSVAVVNKVGGLRDPDEIVAVFRTNTMDPAAFAYPLVRLAQWYNEAMLSIEINRFDTTFSYVRNQLQYPNLYRWKNVDSTNQMSSRWGWLTNQRTKPRLWQTAVHWLRHRMWLNHSKNFYDEMIRFQKESPEDKGAKAQKGEYDDEIIAAMIALYTSHDADWDDNLEMIPVKRIGNADPDLSPWKIICTKCSHTRGAATPVEARFCLNCGSLFIKAEKNSRIDMGIQEEWETLSNEPLETTGAVNYELM